MGGGFQYSNRIKHVMLVKCLYVAVFANLFMKEHIEYKKHNICNVRRICERERNEEKKKKTNRIRTL